jgi:ADP-dependent NAD(P)H-hydrate dehydratase / NAD(P)H-hydrate epimerase
MSWLIIGTVPYKGFPLTDEPCSLADGNLRLGRHTVAVKRGTPALLAAACVTADVLGIDRPQALIAGDIGQGDGSALVYRHLVETLAHNRDKLIVFHYLQPDVDWHNKILIELDQLNHRPILAADAGYMYVAKMSGFASSYDLFTPDVGEMAFLADEKAPHPFYTRGFLLQDEDRAPELISRAYANQNAARCLLVKGRRDYVVSRGQVIAEISEPCVENMEPVGGTGDTLTGIVSALIAGGKSVEDACALGAKINRVMGLRAKPTPASTVMDLLGRLPEAIHGLISESFA